MLRSGVCAAVRAVRRSVGHPLPPGSPRPGGWRLPLPLPTPLRLRLLPPGDPMTATTCACGHHWDDHDEVLDWPENFQPPQRPCCDCGCDNYTQETP